VFIESMSLNTAKNGKEFLNLKLRDKGSSVDAKLWGYSPLEYGWIKEGTVVLVHGKMDEYNGNKQLIIDEMFLSHAPASDFQKSTRFDITEMWENILNTAKEIEEPLAKFLCGEILLSQPAMVEAFKSAPAAKKMHNAWYGGLLEHTNAMCEFGKVVVKHYQKYNKNVSLSKVLFGIIMHDLGKVIEYDFKTPAYNLSSDGLLVTHLIIGPAWIYNKGIQAIPHFIPTEFKTQSEFKTELYQLMHIVASHHGKLEWGSPVVPSSLEALIVHNLDLLDSRLMHAIELIEGKSGPVPHFSEKSFFEGVAFFNYN